MWPPGERAAPRGPAPPARLRLQVSTEFRPPPGAARARFDIARLRRVLGRALRVASTAERVAAGRAVSVVLCDDTVIREYNARFAGDDHATDVLSFPAAEPGAVTGFRGVPDGAPELGDIVISLDRVTAQAGVAGHSAEHELAVLAVHGFLHLLGYDHATPDDERRMFGRTDEILREAGL